MIRQILSYNVNGIRAAMKKGLAEWLQKQQPDMLCLQEIKATESQIDKAVFEYLGYHHYWFPAEKKGYSGVALLSKQKPDFVEKGMGQNDYDSEGRVLRADFGDVTLISVYIPSGTTGGVRQEFKMQFLADFQDYISRLKQDRPNLIISGDYNICHKEKDINRPEKHHKTSGFLPEERSWVDQFLATGFIDSFREFNQEGEQYSWWSYRANARAKNLGWRIDYHMITEPLQAQLKYGEILQEVVHSDHCPVRVDVDF